MSLEAVVFRFVSSESGAVDAAGFLGYGVIIFCVFVVLSFFSAGVLFGSFSLVDDGELISSQR